MARARTIHRCTDCGTASPRWVGRCPGCNEWNTLVEERETPKPAGGTSTGIGNATIDRPVPILEVDAAEWSPRPTGVPELDRVLGGGLVPGSVTLLGGEPGIGKSTLLLQTLAALAETGSTALLVSAEESKQQVRLRAERLDTLPARLWLVSETSLPGIVDALDEIRPDYLVVDSIQTVFDPELGSAPGSVAQVRECAHALVREAKQRAVAIVLVGHVTKEGSLAGPRVLEHVVDTVLSFEGDRHHALRLLRAVKHRFGGTGELGVFEMRGDGLIGVSDPSALFLGDRRPGVAGSAVVPTIEGHRPLLVELQALVSPTTFPQPRRSAQGVDGGRLSLLLAVLAQRVGVAFNTADVYASAVGGARIDEPGADLPLALALTSSLTGNALPANLVAVGEVGLGGELRQVAQMQRRLAEASRLGFVRAVVPASAPEAPDGIRLLRAGTLGEAVELLRLCDDNSNRSAQVVPLAVR